MQRAQEQAEETWEKKWRRKIYIIFSEYKEQLEVDDGFSIKRNGSITYDDCICSIA